MEPVIRNKTESQKIIDPKDAIADQGVVKIYANGVQGQVALVDANLIFQFHERPVAMISLSLPLLKSMRDNIDALISSYETNFNVKVHSVQDLVKNQTKK